MTKGHLALEQELAEKGCEVQWRSSNITITTTGASQPKYGFKH
jgi:hypothetical protein